MSILWQNNVLHRKWRILLYFQNNILREIHVYVIWEIWLFQLFVNDKSYIVVFNNKIVNQV